VRKRWLSGRALRLHAALLIWFPGCLVAGWWQVNRAFDGNGLSYLYSVEWPVFALVGAWGWWALVHTDPDTVGRRAQERLVAASRGAGAGSGATGGSVDAPDDGQPARHREDEDEALAAYNDRLAELAARGPQGWRRR
jgi:hypothetical protein